MQPFHMTSFIQMFPSFHPASEQASSLTCIRICIHHFGSKLLEGSDHQHSTRSSPPKQWFTLTRAWKIFLVLKTSKSIWKTFSPIWLWIQWENIIKTSLDMFSGDGDWISTSCLEATMELHGASHKILLRVRLFYCQPRWIEICEHFSITTTKTMTGQVIALGRSSSSSRGNEQVVSSITKFSTAFFHSCLLWLVCDIVFHKPEKHTRAFSRCPFPNAIVPDTDPNP